MRDARSSTGSTTAGFRRPRHASRAGHRVLGAAVAALLATTGGLAAAAPAAADDSATDETATQATTETTTETTTGGATTPTEVTDQDVEELVVEEPATEEPVTEEPVEETPAEKAPPADEPAADDTSDGVVERVAPGEASEETSQDATKEELDAGADAPIGILVDTEGPGPDSGDLSVMFRAAHPDTYTTANPGAADSSDVQTQLTSNTQNRFFGCGDTIVYYQIVEVGGTAEGESELTVTTDFDTRFGNEDQVGITEVTALLPFDDTGYDSDGEETIVGTTASGTWSDGQISLESTITDVEAGETIIVEYRATLTCGIPPGDITGNLHAGSGGMVITQSDGTSQDVPGAGTQTVPLFANAVLVAPVPVNPTVTQGECPEGGEPVLPTLDLPANTSTIMYSVDPGGPYAPGQTVVVTATLAGDGLTWGELPEGWVMVDEDSAELEVTFADVPCVPVAPVVVQPECPEGVPTEPMLELPDDTDAVSYVVISQDEDSFGYGETVVVVATLEPGYVWADVLPEGWEMVDETTAAFEVTFAEAPCVANPVAPEVVQSQCPDGTVTRPTLTLPTTTGITYSVTPAGPYSGGRTVTVTAMLHDGYGWGTLPAGWTPTSAGATLQVTFGPDAECPKSPPAPPHVPPQGPSASPPLAVTGPDAVLTYAGLAGLALLAGGMLLWVSRRRGLLG